MKFIVNKTVILINYSQKLESLLFSDNNELIFDKL